MNTIRLRGVVSEDFANYKEPSLFLISTSCNFKCCHEGGFSESVCQNADLIKNTTINEYSYISLFKHYTTNPITKAIVVGGMECMLQFDQLLGLIKFFRDNGCDDYFVLYTGYNKDEIIDKVQLLSSYKNIIIKFGRYKINDSQHFDSVLGVNLASNNQYGEIIS